MNVPSTKWTIVSNAPRLVISALMNAGKWQRNNSLALPVTAARRFALSESSAVCGSIQSILIFGGRFP